MYRNIAYLTPCLFALLQVVLFFGFNCGYNLIQYRALEGNLHQVADTEREYFIGFVLLLFSLSLPRSFTFSLVKATIIMIGMVIAKSFTLLLFV